MRSIGHFLALSLGMALCAGCGHPQGANEGGAAPAFKPVDASRILLWDRTSMEVANVTKGLMADFNAQNPGPPVDTEFVGGYGEIFRKVTASIQARTLPAMAVGYENMTAMYARAGAAAPLNDFIADPQRGLSKEELDDFFPAMLETNRYAEFDGKTYSFPFAKSVLIMYFNRKVLTGAGFGGPPKTWEEFLMQCRAIKARTGNPPFPINADCSIVNGIIYSMGGDIVANGTTRYDAPEARKAFQLIETLAKEGLTALITPDSYDDQVAVAQGRAAFAFRSSALKTNMKTLMKDDREGWGMATIPQEDPGHPHTVLYGPCVTIFNTTPEQKERAWAFVRYFTSKDASVRWALGTGYLPMRKSAAEDPRMQRFWGEWAYNRVPFDNLPFARPEPNLPGWEKVRAAVEKGETALLSGLKSADEIIPNIKREADAALEHFHQ